MPSVIGRAFEIGSVSTVTVVRCARFGLPDAADTNAASATRTTAAANAELFIPTLQSGMNRPEITASHTDGQDAVPNNRTRCSRGALYIADARARAGGRPGGDRRSISSPRPRQHHPVAGALDRGIARPM